MNEDRRDLRYWRWLMSLETTLLEFNEMFLVVMDGVCWMGDMSERGDAWSVSKSGKAVGSLFSDSRKEVER